MLSIPNGNTKVSLYELLFGLQVSRCLLVCACFEPKKSNWNYQAANMQIRFVHPAVYLLKLTCQFEKIS